jgi:phosphonate transport system substrate-binding protein
MRRREFIAGAALSVCGLRGAAAIRVGMIPDAGATQVSIDQKGPLRDYLARAIGQEVSLIVPTNYNATVEGLGNGSLDFAYLGGLTYVKAHQMYGVTALVQRAADKQFHSLMIAPAGSALKKPGDLKGKSFAFGDINSTSGHLIPYSVMKAAGLDVDKDLKYRYTGSHPATAKAVESGAVDAGAIDESVFRQMVSSGAVDGKKVIVFYTSQPFLDYVWVARKDIGSAQQTKFSAAFMDLKPGRDAAIIEILRGENFARVNDGEYDDIRRIARELKML